MYTTTDCRTSQPITGTGAVACMAHGMSILLMERAHAERSLAEAFVRNVFLRAYDARLGELYPLLLAVTRTDHSYAAVAGIRPAGCGTLFSEQYLDQPIERLLQTGRDNIAEIGNLAPADTGQARWLICAVSAFLIGCGFTHVVFTSVPKLRNAFRRMGLPLTWLAAADAGRLPPWQRAEWGSYYRHNPAVHAGDIVAGSSSLNALIRSDPVLYELSMRAYHAGRGLAGDGMRSF
jgi:Thermostable hemolysin